MWRWLGTTLLTVGWYALVAGGWLCWWKAHQTAQRLDRELTLMAKALRYPQDGR